LSRQCGVSRDRTACENRTHPLVFYFSAS
jgi:hypothetical protein